MKLAIVATGLALLLSTFTYSPVARAQSTCSTGYDSTKMYCAPVEVGSWAYFWRTSSSNHRGPFESESQAIDHAITYLLSHQLVTYCSLTVSNIGTDPSPSKYVGLDVVREYGVSFDTVFFNNDATPCGRNGTYSIVIRAERKVDCPYSIQGGQDWTLVNSPTLGPRCEIPHTEVFDRQPKLCKGNPCDVLHNTKFEFERDYVGSGPFPLLFERTYDSRKAFKTRPDAVEEEFFYPVGVGWTATYFQSVADLPEAQRKGAKVTRPDGRRIYFNDVAGVMTAQSGVTERLTRLVDGSGNLTGWQLITASDETESYDAEGRLTSIQNREGLIQTVSYGAGAGRFPVSVTDAFGRTLTFTYDTNAPRRLIALTLPDSTQITFTYSSVHNILTANYPGSLTRQYHYELTNERRHQLTGLTDESGTRYATWTYASYASGAYPTSSKLAGNVDQYTFANTSTSTRTVTDPLGQARVYGSTVRKGQRLMTSSPLVVPGSREAKTITYDANGNIATSRDFNNNEARFSYDMTRDLETSRTEGWGTAQARTIDTQWHATFRLPTEIEDAVSRTELDYDTDGNLLSRTVTDLATSQSRVWAYTYDSYGRLLTEDGPRTDVTDVTTYAYYTCTTGVECGQLHTVENALSQTTTFNTYNGHGQPLTITDPNGVVTTLSYDGRQRLTSRTVGSEATTFEYWPTGRLKKVTLPDTSFTLYTYDGAQRLIRIEDGEGNRIEYTLDNMGNRTAENAYDPLSSLVRTRTQVFNNLNQLWKQVGAAGTTAVTTTLTYDTNSNQTGIAAPLARNTSQLFDELNRLKQITDPGSGTTQFAYDAEDNLTSVTDPKGLITSYTYNGFGDLTQQVSPDTGTTVNTYDSGGNLATSTDARSKTGTYGYDALNRVTSTAYPDRTLTYTYDSGTNGVGRLTGASDSHHSLAWSYDAQGRVIGKGQTVGSLTKSVGYGYTNGNLTSLVTPSGQTITYGYTNGRISSVTLNGSTTILSNVLYEPFGAVAGWTWGNSTLAVRVYDLDGKPTDIDSAGAYTYAYDDAFRITGITDVADASKTWSYGYDLLDRLNAASRTSETIGYTYDANGNRLTQTGTTAASYTVSGSSNRVTSITGSPARTYGYDAAGNVTSYSGLSFTYTDAGRMSSVTSGSVTTTYLVNALGQRVRKLNATATVHFVYDEAGHLLGEYDATGALVQETIWMGDTPAATLRPNGSGVNLYYVHTDHLNTPHRISRPSDNAVLWRWDSDPFGSAAANEDPDGDTTLFNYNFRFPGQYFDAESGLSYNYWRDGYDPAVGRYTQSDPIGLDGGINTFAYANNNPLSVSDPSGLVPGAGPNSPPKLPPINACAKTISNAIFAQARRQGWVHRDKRLHCVVSCELVRQCGADYAFVAGWGREINQLLLHGYILDAAKRRDSLQDTVANEYGRDCPPRQNCLTYCSKVY